MEERITRTYNAHRAGHIQCDCTVLFSLVGKALGDNGIGSFPIINKDENIAVPHNFSL